MSLQLCAHAATPHARPKREVQQQPRHCISNRHGVLPGLRLYGATPAARRARRHPNPRHGAHVPRMPRPGLDLLRPGDAAGLGSARRLELPAGQARVLGHQQGFRAESQQRGRNQLLHLPDGRGANQQERRVSRGRHPRGPNFAIVGFLRRVRIDATHSRFELLRAGFAR